MIPKRFLPYLAAFSFSLVLATDPEIFEAPSQAFLSPEEVVIVIGDNVISETDVSSIRKFQFSYKLVGLFAKHPSLVGKIQDLKRIGLRLVEGDDGRGIDKINGTSNIIFAMMRWLEDKYNYQFLELVRWTEDLTRLAVNPAPRKKTISLIKKLRSQGYTVIYASNQDDMQLKFFNQRMRQEGIKLKKVFDGILCNTGFKYKLQGKRVDLEEYVDFPKLDDVFVTDFYKPHSEYFGHLYALADYYRPSAKIIYIDASPRHIDRITCFDKGVKAILFKSTSHLKNELENLGILRIKRIPFSKYRKKFSH